MYDVTLPAGQEWAQPSFKGRRSGPSLVVLSLLVVMHKAERRGRLSERASDEKRRL